LQTAKTAQKLLVLRKTRTVTKMGMDLIQLEFRWMLYKLILKQMNNNTNVKPVVYQR